MYCIAIKSNYAETIIMKSNLQLSGSSIYNTQKPPCSASITYVPLLFCTAESKSKSKSGSNVWVLCLRYNRCMTQKQRDIASKKIPHVLKLILLSLFSFSLLLPLHHLFFFFGNNNALILHCCNLVTKTAKFLHKL